MKQKIKSIERGWGEQSTFFSTDAKVSDSCRVDEIIEETKTLGNGYHNDITATVYRGYKNEKPVFEFYAGNDVTVTFIQD